MAIPKAFLIAILAATMIDTSQPHPIEDIPFRKIDALPTPESPSSEAAPCYGWQCLQQTDTDTDPVPPANLGIPNMEICFTRKCKRNQRRQQAIPNAADVAKFKQDHDGATLDDNLELREQSFAISINSWPTATPTMLPRSVQLHRLGPSPTPLLVTCSKDSCLENPHKRHGDTITTTNSTESSTTPSTATGSTPSNLPSSPLDTSLLHRLSETLSLKTSTTLEHVSDDLESPSTSNPFTNHAEPPRRPHIKHKWKQYFWPDLMVPDMQSCYTRSCSEEGNGYGNGGEGHSTLPHGRTK